MKQRRRVIPLAGYVVREGELYQYRKSQASHKAKKQAYLPFQSRFIVLMRFPADLTCAGWCQQSRCSQRSPELGRLLEFLEEYFDGIARLKVFWR